MITGFIGLNYLLFSSSQHMKRITLLSLLLLAMMLHTSPVFGQFQIQIGTLTDEYPFSNGTTLLSDTGSAGISIGTFYRVPFKKGLGFLPGLEYDYLTGIYQISRAKQGSSTANIKDRLHLLRAFAFLDYQIPFGRNGDWRFSIMSGPELMTVLRRNSDWPLSDDEDKTSLNASIDIGASIAFRHVGFVVRLGYGLWETNQVREYSYPHGQNTVQTGLVLNF